MWLLLWNGKPLEGFEEWITWFRFCYFKTLHYENLQSYKEVETTTFLHHHYPTHFSSHLDFALLTSSRLLHVFLWFFSWNILMLAWVFRMITLVSVLREGEAGLGLNINISFFCKHIDTLFKQKIKLYYVHFYKLFSFTIWDTLCHWIFYNFIF